MLTVCSSAREEKKVLHRSPLLQLGLSIWHQTFHCCHQRSVAVVRRWSAVINSNSQLNFRAHSDKQNLSSHKKCNFQPHDGAKFNRTLRSAQKRVAENSVYPNTYVGSLHGPYSYSLFIFWATQWSEICRLLVSFNIGCVCVCVLYLIITDTLINNAT